MSDITPPPELVQQWVSEFFGVPEPIVADLEAQLAVRAAQWGANQELEACCEWLANNFFSNVADQLRAARRPKPPSLKELALEWLVAAEELHKASGIDPEGTIRRALEALPDD